ncbi:MAG: LemA family protein [Pseudomonadota bacterium]
MAWMAVFLLVLALVAIGLIAQGVALYNGLVQVKHQVDQAWSNIDVLLKQRHDELPKLIDAVKRYLTHERELLHSVTALRMRAQAIASGEGRVEAEQALSQGVSKLLAVAESYPTLRASEVFIDLQQRISALEEQIAHRREFYNAAVNINNVRMKQFPDLLLASMVGLQRKPLFEATPPERSDVDVGSRLVA